MPQSKGFKVREPRIRITKNVVINRTIKAEGLDISESGMYIHTKYHFPVGSIINISFELDKKNLDITAQVLHAQPGVGLGVRFTKLEKDAMDTIVNFITSLAEKIKQMEKQGK